MTVTQQLARRRVTARSVAENMGRIYEACAPELAAEGLDWYRTAHGAAAGLGEEFGCSLEAAAGVISAISPQTGWARNLVDAGQLMAAYQRNPGIGLEELRSVAPMQFRAEIGQALEILRGRHPLTVLTGPKRRAFWANIARPEESGPVTIDVWMVRAMTGRKIPNVLARGRYAWFAEQVRKSAVRAGVRPHEFQAIVWTALRGSAN